MADAGRTSDTLVASFVGPEQAKAAIGKLERAGVPPGDVRLLTGVSGSSAAVRQAADERKVQWFARRALRGAVPGFVIGALVIGIGVSLLWEGESAGAVVAAAAGGAVAGAFIGGFLAVGIAAPRNPAAWDTYLLAHGDEVCIGMSLRSTDDVVGLIALLREAGATSVDRLPDTRGGG
jgi:hypothetical protein